MNQERFRKVKRKLGGTFVLSDCQTFACLIQLTSSGTDRFSQILRKADAAKLWKTGEY